MKHNLIALLMMLSLCATAYWTLKACELVYSSQAQFDTREPGDDPEDEEVGTEDEEEEDGK